MIGMSPRFWLAVAFVALVQTAILAHIVYGRVALLRDGREIVVEVIPVDPRDLFRGDYVILGYGFGRISDVQAPEGTRRGDTVYVTLRPTGPEQWEAVRITPDPVAPDDETNVMLKGIVSYVSWGARPQVSIRYGIESYFVPEGTGRALEKKVREKKISVVLAVGSSGDVAIKSLVVDGERVVEESLL